MLSKENLTPSENLMKIWVNAFRGSTTSEERQLAGYRFILALFQLPTPCHQLDCRHIILTQGDPQKQENLQDFLQWIGVYWPLQAITLHPQDGVVPPSVQQVFQEHQFLHQALHTKLQLDWLYFVPYLEDIIQQSFLTSFWLLDRVGMLMTGKTSAFVTKVSDWPLDEAIFDKIEPWPKRLNQYKDIGKTAGCEPSEKSIDISPQETEESAAWCRFERELYTAFGTLQISVQEKIRRILHALQHPKEQKDTALRLSLKEYIALYQVYEKEHRSLLRLSPSSLADYLPENEKRTVPAACSRPFSLSAFFKSKPESTFTFPYESLPATYRVSSPLILSSHTEAQAPFDVFMSTLIAQWETLSDTPQKANLSAIEQQFILQSLLHPNRGTLSVENLSLSPEGQQNFWFFIEQLLTYNPHIAEIAVPSHWEIPQNIHTLVNKNQQWKASLYYASLPKVDYDTLGVASSLWDAQNHRKNMALSYANKALPWIKNALKGLQSTVPAADYEALKRDIHENYLPTIKALSTHKKIPPLQASMRYEHVFQGCKPISKESTLPPEVQITVLSLR